MFSRYVAHVFSEWLWNSPSRPCYYWYHLCFYTPQRRIYIVRSLYFRILRASFLITFVSPEIATSINTYVPLSLSQIIIITINRKRLPLDKTRRRLADILYLLWNTKRTQNEASAQTLIASVIKRGKKQTPPVSKCHTCLCWHLLRTRNSTLTFTFEDMIAVKKIFRLYRRIFFQRTQTFSVLSYNCPTNSEHTHPPPPTSPHSTLKPDRSRREMSPSNWSNVTLTVWLFSLQPTCGGTILRDSHWACSNT